MQLRCSKPGPRGDDYDVSSCCFALRWRWRGRWRGRWRVRVRVQSRREICWSNSTFEDEKVSRETSVRQVPKFIGESGGHSQPPSWEGSTPGTPDAVMGSRTSRLVCTIMELDSFLFPATPSLGPAQAFFFFLNGTAVDFSWANPLTSSGHGMSSVLHVSRAARRRSGEHAAALHQIRTLSTDKLCRITYYARYIMFGRCMDPAAYQDEYDSCAVRAQTLPDLETRICLGRCMAKKRRLVGGSWMMACQQLARSEMKMFHLIYSCGSRMRTLSLPCLLK